MTEKVTVYFLDGKAFLEIFEGYLLNIGDEAFIKRLNAGELHDLATAIMLEIKNGTRRNYDIVWVEQAPRRVH